MSSPSGPETSQPAGAPPAPRRAGRAQRRPMLVPLLVAGAFFMEFLDSTVLATALPQMAVSFRELPVDLNIGMSAYLLTLAVCIPVSGWMADRFGARRIFSTAIGVFTLASVLCGLSNGLAAFTAARILQGIGGAMMVPVGRLAVLRNTSKADLVNAIAWLTWPALVAPILGPPLGGLITTYASWRWIFFLNVPLGVLGFVFALILIPGERTEAEMPFDWLGFFLSGLACGGLMYGLDLIGQRHNPSPATFLLVGASLVIGVGALWHARRAPRPLLDLSALRIPTFAAVMRGGALTRSAIGSVPFLLPLMFQAGFHYTAFVSGLLVLAVFCGNIGIKPATTYLMRRFGFRTTLIWNGLLAAASIFACGLLQPDTPKPVIVLVLFAGGVFRSMQFTALSTLSFSDIPQPQMTGASTLSSTVQQLTLGLGIALGAVALRLAALRHPDDPTTLSVGDFHLAFALIGLVALVGLYDCISLAPGAGAEVSGHQHPGRKASP